MKSVSVVEETPNDCKEVSRCWRKEEHYEIFLKWPCSIVGINQKLALIDPRIVRTYCPIRKLCVDKLGISCPGDKQSNKGIRENVPRMLVIHLMKGVKNFLCNDILLAKRAASMERSSVYGVYPEDIKFCGVNVILDCFSEEAKFDPRFREPGWIDEMSIFISYDNTITRLEIQKMHNIIKNIAPLKRFSFICITSKEDLDAFESGYSIRELGKYTNCKSICVKYALDKVLEDSRICIPNIEINLDRLSESDIDSDLSSLICKNQKEYLKDPVNSWLLID